MATKLTRTAVEKAEPGKARRWIWDNEVPGFGVCIFPSGARSYYLKYRTQTGRVRKPKIGTHGELTVKQAREIAKDWMVVVRQGGDPSGDRKKARKQLTVEQVAGQYLASLEGLRKPENIAKDQIVVRVHILPRLGKLKVSEVSRRDVTLWRSSLVKSHAKATINRVTSTLRAVFRYAEEIEEIDPGSNPVAGIKPHKVKGRERYLSHEEIGRINRVLDAGVELRRGQEGSLPAGFCLLVRLLLMTGMRLGEVRELKWSQLDPANRRIVLHDSKVGARSVPVAPAVFKHIDAFRWRLPDSEYVCPNYVGKPNKNVHRPWWLTRERAEIGDVRLHDLRHTWASMAINGGVSLEVIGTVLGHENTKTTKRYAHLKDEIVQRAAAKTVENIQRALEGAPALRVVS